MVENSNEKLLTKKVVLNSFKILAKTLILLIFVFFYIISTMFFLAPKFDAKIFNFFGLKKAEEACYVQAYEKSENNADLYNLILFESELQNYEKETIMGDRHPGGGHCPGNADRADPDFKCSASAAER